MQKIRDAGKDRLFDRRHNLAALYNKEIEQWKQQVVSNVETIEERKDRIMGKAYALRDARETARLEYVHEAYKRQWRDANDDSRTLNSNEMTKFMGRERIRQMQDNIEKKSKEGSDNEAFLKEWQRQLDVIEAKDQAKQERRRKANMDQQAGLHKQMAYNENMKQTNFEMRMKEDEEEIKEIQDALAAEEEKIRKIKEDAHARGREVLEFNAQYKDVGKIKAQIQADQDKILLDYALEQERQQIAAEKDKQQAAAQAAQQYRKYLEIMMVKEAEDTGFVDEMNRREFEKVQKARDDALQAREDARSHLMSLVKAGRVKQIQEKKEREISQREADRIYASKFADDIKEGLAMDQAATDNRRRKAEFNNTKLMEQIAAREMAEKLTKQEMYLDEKRMKHIERKHQANLAAQQGTVRLNYKRTKKD